MLRTAKTMFAMSRDLARPRSMLASWSVLRSRLQRTGPGRRWWNSRAAPTSTGRLTSLPVPLVSIDMGTEGERVGIMAEFNGLDNSAVMSAVQIQRFIAHMDKILSQPDKPSISAALDVREGRKDDRRGTPPLFEYGLPMERLSRFPSHQVILLDEKQEYEVRRDDSMKLMNLPIWQVQSLAADMESARGADGLRSNAR